MFKNIVKNTVAALVLAAPFVSFAAAPVSGSKFSHLHKPGFSIQLMNGSPDYAYYTKDHSYTMGLILANLEEQTLPPAGTRSQDTHTYGGFVRKNFKIDDNTQYGIGTSAKFYKGDYMADQDFRTDAYNVTPVYFAVEYFISPKVGISSSYKPFRLESTGTKNQVNSSGVTQSGKARAHVLKRTFLTSGSVQLNYIFG